MRLCILRSNSEPHSTFCLSSATFCVLKQPACEVGTYAVQMSLCSAAAACKVAIACDLPNDQPGGTGAVCAPYKKQRYRLAGCLRICSTGIAPSLPGVTCKYPQSGAGPGGTAAGYGCWTGCCRPAGCRRAARACACPPASAASPSRRPCSCLPYPTLPRVRKNASSTKCRLRAKRFSSHGPEGVQGVTKKRGCRA